jgi:hypothetical protein|tara:strand:- start:215 stop:385 length:171 start_codon:yes stop_codon:yes gene_type:complete
MSRKDYEKIAFVLGVEKASKRMVKHFCKMLQADNNNFKEEVFINAVNNHRDGVVYR